MTSLGKGLFNKIKRNNSLSYLKEEFELLFTHFPGTCMLCDHDGVIIEKNPMVAQFISCDEEALITTPVFELLNLNKSAFDLAYLDAITKGEIINFKSDLMVEENGIKNIEVMILPIVKKETLAGMFVIFIDLSEKMQLQKKSNQFEENIIHTQRLLKTGSWTYDLRKEELFSSDEAYDIFERSKEEFDNRLESFYSYVHPQDREHTKKSLEDSLTGNPYDDSYRIVTPSGKEKYIQSKGEVLFDEKGKAMKLFGTIQDITEQKLIERDLKRIGKHLNHAQRVAGVGSYRYDFSEDEVYWSEEIYKIYGIYPQDFNKSVESILRHIHPEDQIKLKDALDKCKKGLSYGIEYRIMSPDGSMKYVVSKGEPLYDENQNIIGILGTLQEVTEKRQLQQQLEKSNDNLMEAQRLTKMGSWDMDIIKMKTYWSEECYRIYGITPEDYDGTFEGFLKFVHPEDKGLIQKLLTNPPEEQPFTMEFRIIRNDGAIRYVYQIVEITFNEDKEPVFIKGTIQDVTTKKEIERKMTAIQEKIADIQRRFQMLVQDSDDIFEIIDTDGIIQYISPAVEKVIGYSPNEITGKNVLNFVEGADKITLKQMLDLVIENPDKSIKENITTRTRHGEKIFVEVSMKNQLSEPSIEGIVVNWRDVTERVASERKIAYMANYDELTKLPNRFYFNNRITRLCQKNNKRNSTFAVLMLNIDGFKYINHSLGMKSGDTMITEIVKRLQGYLGDDRFICRYSADQFGVLVTDIGQMDRFQKVAQELVDLFNGSFKVEMYELFITVSIGVAVFPEDGQDAEALIKGANIALLRAKESGKNRYEFYSPNMDVKNYKEFNLRNDLRKAIEKNQFKVYYQPLVNLQRADVIAAEALIRWEHPDWGMVSPNEFIHLAEETGLIIDLGNWIFQEVCHVYKNWLNKGLKPIKMSINYSSIQFFEKEIVENIKMLLDELQLDPSFLIIELTESALINNIQQVISNIQSLQAIGVQIAIDDFGTGFSSLAYLSSFNVDIIKIDRSFIKDVPDNEVSTKITKAVVNLSRDLEIKLVAEGIENWEQLSYLSGLDCYAGQGFLYSKPVPLEDFEKILTRGKCTPSKPSRNETKPKEERRKYFRVILPDLLEADMTILSINGKKTDIGKTGVVVKNIGPGGLCFVSNIKLPVNKEIILQFKSELSGEEIKAYGSLDWIEERDYDLFEYGLVFTFDEKARTELTKVLNQFQVKTRKDSGYRDGRFFTKSLDQYFHSKDRKH